MIARGADLPTRGAASSPTAPPPTRRPGQVRTHR
jgi:hypothetical protein